MYPSLVIFTQSGFLRDVCGCVLCATLIHSQYWFRFWTFGCDKNNVEDAEWKSELIDF